MFINGYLPQVPLTGCGINPARALATNIVAGEIKGDFYVSSFYQLNYFIS